MDYTKAPAVVSISPEAQRGWIAVGHFKNEVANLQQAHALKLQEIINSPGVTITEIESCLANYRKVHSEMKKDGQEFRAFITSKVLQPSLDIEKQYDPKVSDAYLTAEKQLLDKKIEQDNANKQTQAKAQEKLNYEAHIKNEYLRVANDLRIAGLKEINQMYINYLKGKVKKPDTNAIKETIKTLVENMHALVEIDTPTGKQTVRRIKAGTYNVYPTQYLGKEEKQAIIQSIVAPDYDKIREDLIEEVDKKFASYQHDLAADNVEQVEVVAAEEVAEIAAETVIEAGVNQMQAAASVPVVMTEGKAIRRTMEIVVEGTESWHLSVIAAYLKNPLCRKFVTAKKWENLTVAQMCAALTKYSNEIGEEFEGLTYREVVK